MNSIHDIYRRLIRNPAWFWSTDAGLSALLVSLTLYIFIISPLSKHYNMGEALNGLFILVILSGVFSASPSSRLRQLMLVVAIPIALIRWISIASTRNVWLALQHGFSAVFFGMIAVMLIMRVFERGPKTGHRVQGAVAVYLMQGMMWAALYQLVDVMLPGAFQFPATPEGDPLSTTARDSSFIYFSFVTLTTVGYGDVLAVDPFARSLAMMEALSGQLFPAVLIARIVALQVSEDDR
jgi:voltage-gated potassium channel Kch